MLRDKFEMASVDLNRTIKSMEDFVTTFNDLYIEDVTFKNDMRENIKRELRRTVESFTEFEKFLDENNF